jgi:hypothetical protein
MNPPALPRLSSRPGSGADSTTTATCGDGVSTPCTRRRFDDSGPFSFLKASTFALIAVESSRAPSVNTTSSRSRSVKRVRLSSYSHAVARLGATVPSGRRRTIGSYTAWKYGR